MERLIILSPTQPVENAVSENVYFGGRLIAVRLTAEEGYELVKDGEEPSGIKVIDIPSHLQERVGLYKSIIKTETEETENDNN